MVITCCVPGCKNDYSSGAGFHHFPKDPLTRKKWIAKTKCFRMTFKMKSSWDKVCKDHFKDEDFTSRQKKYLKKGVVPSINLPTNTLPGEHNYCFEDSMKVSSEEENLSDVPFVDVPPITQETLNEMDEDYEVISIQNEPVSHEICENCSHDHVQIEIPIANTGSTYLNQKYNCQMMHQCTQTDHISFEPYQEENGLKMQSEKTRTKKGKKPYNSDARKLRYYRTKLRLLREKLKKASDPNVEDNEIFRKLCSNLTNDQVDFLKMILKNSGKNKKGRDFTFEQKCLALAIYKHSPKSYRFLLKLLPLPSRQTLNKHAALIRFEAGINQNLLNYVKENVKNLSEIDKLCTVVWDEINIHTHLDFQETKGYIDGFVDYGNERVNEFATHILVFMVRGINKPFKQPISYFVVDSHMKSGVLAELIKLNITAILSTGLSVVGSVCDQASTNISAVGILVHESRKGLVRERLNGALLKYSIEGTSIIHWFDPPHLIKGIRNNLLTKNLVHYVSYNGKGTSTNTRKRTASWEHITKFYEDNKHLIQKITEHHIKPKRKMKVKIASQVFSKTFGEAMKCNGKRMGGTSDILMFFNDFFDSLNGSGNPIKNGIKGSVSAESGHQKFWEYAIKMLSKMEFIILTGESAGKTDKRSKTISSMISTAKAFQELSVLLMSKNMKSFAPRRLNQDALENFFGGLRACCSAAVKPTTRNFRTAWSTMIVNNLSTKHSINFNCEEDQDVSLLNGLHMFYRVNNLSSNNLLNMGSVTGTLDKSNKNINEEGANKLFKREANKKKSVLKEHSIKHAESVKFIYKKLLQKTKCEKCICIIKDSQSAKRSAIAKLQLKKVLQILIEILEPKIKENYFQVELQKKVIATINFDEKIGCDEHMNAFTDLLIKVAMNSLISSYTKKINELLSAKSVDPLPDDPLEQKAFEFSKKGKHIGKYSPPATTSAQNARC